LNDTLNLFGGQLSGAALQKIAAEIKSKTNETELWFYMQGNRYVLWNFQNIFPNPKTGRCTGTVEFRGGNQFLSTKGTLAWVAFVLGFITLASQEDLLNKFTAGAFVDADDEKFGKNVEEWWKRIRRAARKSRLSRYLPEEHTKMKSR
jgi:hypothetical protein